MCVYVHFVVCLFDTRSLTGLELDRYASVGGCHCGQLVTGIGLEQTSQPWDYKHGLVCPALGPHACMLSPQPQYMKFKGTHLNHSTGVKLNHD